MDGLKECQKEFGTSKNIFLLSFVFFFITPKTPSSKRNMSQILNHIDSPLDTQIGGHAGMFSVREPGKITKETTGSEVDFYAKTLQKTKGLSKFCPLSYGTNPPKEGKKGSVIMEDLCHGFAKPCLLDLKIGTTSVGADASEAKVKKMYLKDRESTTHSMGVRFTGMRIWDAEKGEFEKFDKAWGVKIKEEEFADNLALFFGKGGEGLVEEALGWARDLQGWMGVQTELRFISSSILFVYDGEDKGKGIRLRMIDFAHVFPLEEPNDASYLLGIGSVIKNLEECKKKL